MMDEDKHPADPPQDEESLRIKLLSDKEEDEDWYSWLTTQEAATLSGYDIQHVRRLAREGKIGAVKRGRDWWIDFAKGLSPGSTSWPQWAVDKFGLNQLQAIVQKLEVGTEKAKLQTEKDKLEMPGRSALTVRKKEDVVEQHAAARKAYLNLQALKDAALDEALKRENKPIEELSEFLAVPALAGLGSTREAVDTMTK